MPTKMYFISGHLILSEEEFNIHYKPHIDAAIKEGSKFVVGDAKGTDLMAQTYLKTCCETKDQETKDLCERITVYHMFEAPRFNIGKFKTCGGFICDDDRDAQMTKDSTDDILWIRSAEESKKLYGKKFNPKRISGTEKNKLRRIKK